MTDIPQKHLVAGFWCLLLTVCLIVLGAAGLTAYVTVENIRHPAMTCDQPTKPLSRPLTP